MAVEEKDNKQNEGKGFAGLSSLVSNVDTTPPRAAEKEAIDSATSPGSAIAQPVQPLQTHQESAQSSSDFPGEKWTLLVQVAIVVVVVVVVISVIFSLIKLGDSVWRSSPSIFTSTPLPSSGNLQSQTPPKFNEYPSEVFAGPRATAKLVSDFDKNFRTRIKKTQSQPINFAGEYVLSTWGCGTSCSVGVAVSARTGKVVELPGSICCWQGEGDNVIFKKNSRLLVIAGLINEEGENGTHFYEIKNDLFLHVKTIKNSIELTSEYSSATEPVLTKKSPENYTPDLFPVQPQAQKIPAQEQPPVGSGLILSETQIRYCLAEDIRTDGSKSALNNYSDGDVDRFNAIVADYNSRCANFRYHRGALESARRDMEPYRTQLQIEGRTRFVNLSSRQPENSAISAQSESNVFGSLTYETSFDCTKAKSIPENLICHDPILAEKDKELAVIFERAKIAVLNKPEFRQRARNQWNYREKNCKNRDCVESWYEYQKSVLQKIAQTGDVNSRVD